MITESARVVALDGDRITVEAAIKTTCSSCQVQSDCGTGTISRALAPKSQRLELVSPHPVRLGDTVKIGVPEAGIVSASVWLYVLPLLVLVGSALLFDRLLPTLGLASELWVLAASVLTTLAAFVVISGRLKKLDKRRFQPVLLSVGQPAADITHSQPPV